jgi:hypothetical protein
MIFGMRDGSGGGCGVGVVTLPYRVVRLEHGGFGGSGLWSGRCGGVEKGGIHYASARGAVWLLVSVSSSIRKFEDAYAAILILPPRPHFLFLHTPATPLRRRSRVFPKRDAEIRWHHCARNSEPSLAPNQTPENAHSNVNVRPCLHNNISNGLWLEFLELVVRAKATRLLAIPGHRCHEACNSTGMSSSRSTGMRTHRASRYRSPDPVRAYRYVFGDPAERIGVEMAG